jgi:predicted lactoylglutathione lyase
MVSENFIMHPKSGWADHVFINQYELPELNEIENFIKENGYLPNVRSKKEVIEIGYTQHNINVRLLEYVEQLILHKIRQSDSIEDSRVLLSEQKKKIDKFVAHLDVSQ